MLMKVFPAIVALIAFFTANPALAQAETGQQAPQFEAKDVLSGNQISLSSFSGQPMVLEWSNHECPYVRKHYDSGNMQNTQGAARELGAVWITIVSSAPGNQGHTSEEEARRIVQDEEAGIAAKILDESGEIGKLYGAKTTPHMFVISGDGRLVYSGAIDDQPGLSDGDFAEAENYVISALERLKEGRQPEPSVTQPYGCSVKY